jgi:arabinofuranosyltransferase
VPGSPTVDVDPDADRPSEPAARPTAATGHRVLAVALLLIPVAIVLFCGWQRRWTADDGFINLRVVKQVVAGNGPVYNVGQRVEVGTSPAWIAVLSALDVLTPFRLEWIAAITGLLSTAGAVALAIFGTRRALLAIGVAGLFLPLGALVYVSVPPAWDFATSGLETGLALLWLAVCWWLLSGRVAPGTVARAPWYVPMALGLGPLVRPDFLVFSIGFVLALVLLSGRAEALRVILFAAALPVLTELARMAYFASLVPNTAMAKEASLSNWSQGWKYLTDFGGTYLLFLPLLLLAGICWFQLRALRGAHRYVLLSTVVAITGAVHALYVVEVGGDFMHGRMLLPAFFVLLLPVSVVVARGTSRIVAGAIVVWAVLAMFVFRPSYSGTVPYRGPAAALAALDRNSDIGDERLFYTRKSSEKNPVTIDDYLRHDLWAQAGVKVRKLAASERHPVLILQALADEPTVVPLRRGSAPRTVASAENLGVYAYAAGTDLDVIDSHGLADVIAGHQRLREHGRPGHEKVLPDVWTFARYAAPGDPIPDGMTAAQVEAARRALACGGMRQLVEHTNGPWTLGDTPGNLVEAMRSFRFSFDQDPVIAARELCGS